MLLKKTKYLLVLLIILLGGSTLNAQQWTQMADFPGLGRHRATGISIGNKGYLGFGHINGTGIETAFNDWWEYDPSNNSWTQKASCPVNVLNNTPWIGISVLDSQGFVIDDIAYLKGPYYAPFFSYSASQNTWQILNTGPVGMSWTTAAISLENKGYVYAARNIYIYEPSSDSWTTLNNFSPPVFADITEWHWQNIHSVGSKMYFIAYSVQNDQTHFWEYDLIDESWKDLGFWPHEASDPYVFDHQGLIIVDCGGVQQVSNDVFAYEPKTNTWIQMEDFIGGGRRYSAGFSLNGMGHMCTGTSGVNYSDLWRMNDILGTDDLINELAVNVFPNPAVEHITIALEEHTSFKVELVDPSGKFVGSHQTLNGKIKIQRGDLPSGSYHYVIETDNGLRTSGKFLFD